MDDPAVEPSALPGGEGYVFVWMDSAHGLWLPLQKGSYLVRHKRQRMGGLQAVQSSFQ